MHQYSVECKRKTKCFRRKADAKAFMATDQGQPEINVEKPFAESQKAEPIAVGGVDGPLAGEVRKATVKLSTYCSYEQLIRSHIKPQIGVNTLTGEDLQDFFNKRRAQGNLKREGGCPFSEIL